MGKLQNRRHEIFAVELAAGAPMLSAYLAAGYKDSPAARFNASRLKNTPKVRMRIDELLTEFSRTTFVKLEWIQHQLVEIIEGRGDSCITVGKDGEVTERNRLAALTTLAKTIGGFTKRIEIKQDVGDGLLAALSSEDQSVLAEFLEELAAAEKRGQPEPLPSNESAPAQRVTSCNPISRTQPAAPPGPEPLRPARARFLQLARLRAGAARPLSSEFSVLRPDIQRMLINAVSPVRREPNRSTWPSSPVEIREALECLAPVQINELLNLMAAKSDTFQAFDSAL